MSYDGIDVSRDPNEYESLIEGYPGLDDPDNDPGPLSDEENQKLEEELVPAAAIAQGAELPPQVCTCRHGIDTEDCGAWDCINKERVVDVVEMTKQAWAEHDAREDPDRCTVRHLGVRCERPAGHAGDHYSTYRSPALEEPPHEPGDWPEDDEVMSAAAVAIEEQLPAPKLDELRALRPDQQPIVGHHYVIFQGVPRPVQRASAITEDEHARTIGTIPDEARRQRADRSLRQRYRGYLCGEIASL